MNIKHTISIILLSLISPLLLASNTVTMISNVPYSEDSRIKANIINECTALGTKLSSFAQQFGKKMGVDIELKDSIDTTQGRVLQVEITDAMSRGNAFVGHSKYMDIEGTLWENGQEVASFTATRVSGGGFMGNYKGSCSVLGRCSKALGKDVATWLKNPIDNTHLGD